MYDWLKAFHVIAIIAWMAGILYLPRLFVYHCGAAAGSELSDALKVMERRLLRVIVNPAMIASWILGVWLGIAGSWFSSGWLSLKLLLVLALSGLHGFYARWVRAFARDQNPHSQEFYRVINELPTVLLIAIVILAVVKPF